MFRIIRFIAWILLSIALTLLVFSMFFDLEESILDWITFLEILFGVISLILFLFGQIRDSDEYRFKNKVMHKEIKPKKDDKKDKKK